MPTTLAKQTRIAETHAFKRQAILEAAREVVSAKGAEALTIRNVAAAAGYTPGAVYSYFANRDDLALELLGQDLGQLLRTLKTLSSTSEQNAHASTQALLAEIVESLQNSDAFAPHASALFDIEKNTIDSQTGRMLTGRFIQILQVLSQSVKAVTRDGDNSEKDTLTFIAFAIGLSTLAKSGRLPLLGFTSESLIEHALDRIMK